MDPVLSPEHLEDILARRTVQWTVRHVGGQFFFLSELMRSVPGNRPHLCGVYEVQDVGVVISAAVGGYFAGSLPSSALLAVLKLHGCANPRGWMKLPAGQSKRLAVLTSGVNFLKPTYAWQGEDACLGTQWTNCLGLRDTQRLLAFIARAWSEKLATTATGGSITTGTAPRQRAPFSRLLHRPRPAEGPGQGLALRAAECFPPMGIAC